RTLRIARPNIFIDLQIHTHQSLSMLLSLSSGASIRIGLKRAPDWARDRFLTHSIYFNRHQPLFTVFRQVGNLLGLGPLTQSPKIPMIFSLKEQERVLKKIDLPDPRKRLLVINPNASRLSHERRWPREQFSALIEAFLQKFPETNVVLTGSQGEYDYNQPILDSKDISGQVIRNVAGQLSLQETATLLKHALPLPDKRQSAPFIWHLPSEPL
ncbi:glycosyl transferase, family 9, partial [mine drainage metagenome]